MPREAYRMVRQADGLMFAVPGPEQEAYTVKAAAARWRVPPEWVHSECRKERVPGARLDEETRRFVIPGAVVEGGRPTPRDPHYSQGFDYLRHLDGPVEMETGGTWTVADLPEGVAFAQETPAR